MSDHYNDNDNYDNRGRNDYSGDYEYNQSGGGDNRDSYNDDYRYTDSGYNGNYSSGSSYNEDDSRDNAGYNRDYYPDSFSDDGEGYTDGKAGTDDIQDFWTEDEKDTGRDPDTPSGSGRRRGIGHLLFNLIPIAAIIVLVVSGYLFFRDWKNYHDAGEEYAQVGEMIQQPSDENAASETMQPAQTDMPDLNIDFKGLQAANPDFIGVLYVPALDLTYPFVNGVDNETYLHTTFYGTQNPSGCIFLDCNSSPDLSDRFSVIYGHNMKNMTMFGSLKKFSQDQTLAEENPYFYLYLPDRTMKYRIYGYETISNQDSMYYQKTETDDQYDTLIKRLRSKSQYAPDDLEFDFADRPDLVTLSTCWGTAHVDNFIVNGALVDVQENDGGESSTGSSAAGNTQENTQ